MSSSESDLLLAGKGQTAVYDEEATPPEAECILTESQDGQGETEDSKKNDQEGGTESEHDDDFFGVKLNSRTLSLLPGDACEELAVQLDDAVEELAVKIEEAVEEIAVQLEVLSETFLGTSSDAEPAGDAHMATISESGENVEKEVQDSQVHEVKAISALGLLIRAVLPYILLAVAVTALSSIGPLLAAQHASTMMKIVWRNSATSFVLFPFAASSIRRNGWPPLDVRQWVVLAVAAGCLSGCTALFALSLEYTTVGNAVVFSNMSSLIFLCAKLLMGEKPTLMEGGGALVAFVGAFMCSHDSASNEQTVPATTGIDSYFGDFLAFMATIAYVLYMVCAKNVRSSMEVPLFMFFIVLFGTVESIFFVELSRSPFSWGMDVDYGLFGWLAPQFDRLPVEIIVVVVCNLLGIMGYVRCMTYFSNLVLAAAAQIEAVVAEFIALLLGVGTLPGLMGWLGKALVVGGTVAVIFQPSGAGQSKTSH